LVLPAGFVWWNLRVKYLSENYTWSATPAKWLRAVTLANTVVTSLLLVYIYAAIRLLAGATVVSILPMSIVLPFGAMLLLLGIALSVTGFVLTKRVVSHTSRRVAYFINGFALAIPLLMIVPLAMLWLFSSGLIGKLSDMH
jgi:hypothetical protein